MKHCFISDLHLSEKTPELTQAFLKFLNQSKEACTHFYILGDLFETWIGDDDNSPFNTKIKEALSAFTANGPETFFIHGNRDFLCGQEFALRSNLTLLPDPFFINFFDQNIALSHGDDFCTNDHQYIEFKKEVRSQKWQDTFLKKTLDERLKIASNMRDASQTNNSGKDMSIMDVTISAIDEFFVKHQIDLLIHGHTHRPKIHHSNVGTRIVLGDWHETGWCLFLDQEQQELKEFKL